MNCDYHNQLDECETVLPLVAAYASHPCLRICAGDAGMALK